MDAMSKEEIWYHLLVGAVLAGLGLVLFGVLRKDKKP